jgi:hypothetical protein
MTAPIDLLGQRFGRLWSACPIAELEDRIAQLEAQMKAPAERSKP